MFPPLRLRQAISLGGLTPRELAVRTWEKSIENELMTRAAAIAFYAMMALVPFLGLVITLAVHLSPTIARHGGTNGGIGHETVSELDSTFKSFFPPEAYSILEAQISRLQSEPKVGIVSVGIIIMLWLASSLFVAIIDAMNRVYGVHETRSWLKVRLVAIAMTVTQAIILLGSLLAIVAWPQIVRLMGLSVQVAAVATLLQWVAVSLVVLLSFALAFYYGPDAEQRWEWITPGSVLGTAIFFVESLLFRAYVQHFANYDQTYGALGGVMVMMFWLWLSSLVLLATGQMNKLIEDASPLGKSIGQKVDPIKGLDLESIQPEPAAKDQGEPASAGVVRH
jgi:membrane protein